MPHLYESLCSITPESHESASAIDSIALRLAARNTVAVLLTPLDLCIAPHVLVFCRRDLKLALLEDAQLVAFGVKFETPGLELDMLALLIATPHLGKRDLIIVILVPLISVHDNAPFAVVFPLEPLLGLGCHLVSPILFLLFEKFQAEV